MSMLDAGWGWKSPKGSPTHFSQALEDGLGLQQVVVDGLLCEEAWLNRRFGGQEGSSRGRQGGWWV